jgi:hypothetical protein
MVLISRVIQSHRLAPWSSRFAVHKYRLLLAEENRNLLRPILFLVTLCLLLACVLAGPLVAQDKPAQDKSAPAKTPPKTAPNKTAQDKPAEKPATPPQKPGSTTTPTAEQVAESVIFVFSGNGGRAYLEQIRRNGIERGRITRITAEGRTEEATYERRFVRGADATKDKIRVDQKMPTMEYSLVYGDGRLWGIINGANFTPRQDAAASFMSQQWHSIEALLRYKENGSTVAYVDKMKHKGLELFVLDLLDKEKRHTRYYISAKTLRVLWLEYEEAPEPGSAPVKYARRFHDYRPVQNTLLPYRTVLSADDKQLQETRVSTVTFGIKIDDEVFKNPEQANANP